MLLMVEKGIRGQKSYSIYRYSKANDKHMTNYDKSKESWYLQSWDLNIYMVKQCCQSFQ